jgi:F-type H+-transporting ATPase subunit epsilon
MASEMRLVILLADKTFFDGNVLSFNVTTEKGQLGILPHHTDLIAKLEISPLTVNENGHVHIYSIGGGRIQIIQKENTAYLLVDSIERAEDIDKERALRAKENAEKALEEAESQREYYRAEIKLKRALNRLSISNNLH